MGASTKPACLTMKPPVLAMRTPSHGDSPWHHRCVTAVHVSAWAGASTRKGALLSCVCTCKKLLDGSDISLCSSLSQLGGILNLHPTMRGACLMCEWMLAWRARGARPS